MESSMPLYLPAKLNLSTLRAPRFRASSRWYSRRIQMSQEPLTMVKVIIAHSSRSYVISAPFLLFDTDCAFFFRPCKNSIMLIIRQSTYRFFPLQLRYHYINRDLSNCLEKFSRISTIRKGKDWRDAAGEAGCKYWDMYETDTTIKELKSTNDFCAWSHLLLSRDRGADSCRVALSTAGSSTQDFSMANSCYGIHLVSMIRIMKGIVEDYVKSEKTPKIYQVPGFPHREDPQIYRDAMKVDKQ